MAEYLKPLPTVTQLDRPYWEGCKQGELRLQKCRHCGHRWFPPSFNCPECLSTEVGWERVSGKGRVWSWIIMHQRYFRSFEQDIPYNVIFVQLEEGPMLMSSLVGIPSDQIRCDMPVEVVFEKATEDISVAKFRPVS